MHRVYVENDEFQGSVYILVNQSMPDMVKLGRTAGNPAARAVRLSATSGIPTEFEVAHAELVGDCWAVESRLHKRFEAQRVNSRREFFRVPVGEAIEALVEEASRYPTNRSDEIRLSFLSDLEFRCRRWLRHDLTGAFLVQLPDALYVDVTFQPYIVEDELEFLQIGLGDIKRPDGTYFAPDRNPESNLDCLLRLDTHALAIHFPFFSDEGIEYIERTVKIEGWTPHGPGTPRRPIPRLIGP